MRALESMRSKMKQTGMYTLDGSTLVDRELQAYAVGLDMVFDALAELQEESYVATASGYGLSLREQLFHIAPQGGTEERRAAILGYSAVTPKGSSTEAVQRTMNAAGLPCELCEMISEQKVYVNCLAQNTDETAKNRGVKIAKLFLPAHLSAELDFRSISWNNIDQADETFDNKDGRELTWDSIDCYENALLQI